jgi:hypothetical protein
MTFAEIFSPIFSCSSQNRLRHKTEPAVGRERKICAKFQKGLFLFIAKPRLTSRRDPMEGKKVSESNLNTKKQAVDAL